MRPFLDRFWRARRESKRSTTFTEGTEKLKNHSYSKSIIFFTGTRKPEGILPRARFTYAYMMFKTVLLLLRFSKDGYAEFPLFDHLLEIFDAYRLPSFGELSEF